MGLSTEQLTRVTGTLDYMSPEMFQNHKYNNTADIWSLGVLAFVMLATELLLPEDQEAKREKLKDPGYVKRRLSKCTALKDRGLSANAQDFLEKMLEYDPSKRITAHGLSPIHSYRTFGARALAALLCRGKGSLI